MPRYAVFWLIAVCGLVPDQSLAHPPQAALQAERVKQTRTDFERRALIREGTLEKASARRALEDAIARRDCRIERSSPWWLLLPEGWRCYIESGCGQRLDQGAGKR